MLTTLKNWKLSSYTNSTWTNVVAEQATVSTIIVANTTASAIDVSMRLNGTTTSIFVPTTSVAAYSSYTIDIKGLNVLSTDTLQIFASAAGLNFVISGAV